MMMNTDFAVDMKVAVTVPRIFGIVLEGNKMHYVRFFLCLSFVMEKFSGFRVGHIPQPLSIN